MLLIENTPPTWPECGTISKPNDLSCESKGYPPPNATHPQEIASLSKGVLTIIVP